MTVMWADGRTAYIAHEKAIRMTADGRSGAEARLLLRLRTGLRRVGRPGLDGGEAQG